MSGLFTASVASLVALLLTVGVLSFPTCSNLPPQVFELSPEVLANVVVNPFNTKNGSTQPVLIHNVTLIDPSVNPARRVGWSVLLKGGRVGAVGPAGQFLPASPSTIVLNYTGLGRSVTPAMVGMHEHLFYPIPAKSPLYSADTVSFPSLYLAAGVTTARTTGSMHPYADLAATSAIHSGRSPGPRLFPTTPYVNGLARKGYILPQFANLSSTEKVVNHVRYWIGAGFTNIKLYIGLLPADSKAAIQTAHSLGARTTGHICNTALAEAAEFGTDCLEHGPIVSSDFFPPGLSREENCRFSSTAAVEALASLNVSTDPRVKALINTLIKHNTTLSSTLAVFEAELPHAPPLATQEEWVKPALLPPAWNAYLAAYKARANSSNPVYAAAVKNEALFERAFAEAGGRLVCGADPTGAGGVVAGAADLRNLELLVSLGGFSPLEALRISSTNGAAFFKEPECIGTLQPGAFADLIVVQGDPTVDISAMRQGVLVFKDGFGYDPQKLRAAAYKGAPVTWE